MKVVFGLVMAAIVAMVVFALGAIVVRLVGGAPDVLGRFWRALLRGDVVAWLGAGGIAVLLVVLVVMWRGASTGGVHRRGHWEVRGEDREWVPHDD
ncbi:hypothetical protein ACQPW3_22000 [Actinosynnema sp. CA-248983]